MDSNTIRTAAHVLHCSLPTDFLATSCHRLLGATFSAGRSPPDALPACSLAEGRLAPVFESGGDLAALCCWLLCCCGVTACVPVTSGRFGGDSLVSMVRRGDACDGVPRVALLGWLLLALPRCGVRESLGTPTGIVLVQLKGVQVEEWW